MQRAGVVSQAKGAETERGYFTKLLQIRQLGQRTFPICNVRRCATRAQHDDNDMYVPLHALPRRFTKRHVTKRHPSFLFVAMLVGSYRR